MTISYHPPELPPVRVESYKPMMLPPFAKRFVCATMASGELWVVDKERLKFSDGRNVVSLADVERSAMGK